MAAPRNPFPTVDIIIEYRGGIILVKRRNPPYGWAIPGGFVDCGESLEEAAAREVKEETGLTAELVRQFHAYSEPDRDTRSPTVSVGFIARGKGELQAAEDAVDAGVFTNDNLAGEIAFDHRAILE